MHLVDCVSYCAIGGLVDGKHVSVEEQVAMFLSILAHHKKNRVVKFNHHQPDPVPNDSSNPRWKWFKEGSASDARVLRDSISWVHGLKVPIGNYYLCDNGYANNPDFLSPYRSVRYHLSEWGPQYMRPQTCQEHFNMRHTRARNVIERVFGIVKMWWGILRSTSLYPIKT
ncbi:hypothetical protein ACS0TY_026409 [Phlomoides rotata]